MKIAVIGAGYVGLTTAVSLAWVGHDVHVVERDETRLARLQAGSPPFFEEHLAGTMVACAEQLHFGRSYESALAGAEVAFIAVGTPSGEDGAPDLSQVEGALGQVLDAVSERRRELVLVVKSTVPVGTGDLYDARVADAGLVGIVHLAANPEFLRQGRALHDSLYPDRIVIGGAPDALVTLRRVYRPVADQSFEAPSELPRPGGLSAVPLLEVDRRSAELAKYAANGYLAMRISYINEIANLCDRLGADVDAVASIIGADHRIGNHFLHAGVGFGGSCFPKDTRALAHIARENGYAFELIAAVIRVNGRQRARVLERLELSLGGVGGRRVALLGLAFKPGTDDMREAPSVPLAQALVERGAEVVGHDPRALEQARRILPGAVALASSPEEALLGADAAVLLTEWPQYLALTPNVFRAAMRRPLVIDGRNALSDAVRHDLEYYGIGRPVLTDLLERHDAVAAD